MTFLYIAVAVVSLLGFLAWLWEPPRRVKDRVAYVALGALVDDDELHKRAREMAPSLRVGELRRVVPGGVRPVPAEAIQRFGGAAELEWPSYCAAARYALLEEKGEPALKMLRREALGSYDCEVRPFAIGTLCRLAERGIGTDATLAALGEALPQLDQRVVLSTVQALAQSRLSSPAVVAGICHHIDRSDDADEAKLDMVRLLSDCGLDAARTYEPYLRRWMRGEIKLASASVVAAMAGVIDGNPVATRVLKDGTVLQEQDGKVSVKQWGRHGEPYEDMYAIRASIFLYELLPGDPEATERLRHWAVTHPDRRARAMLAGWLEQHAGGK